jgi:hypothetical protein
MQCTNPPKKINKNVPGWCFSTIFTSYLQVFDYKETHSTLSHPGGTPEPSPDFIDNFHIKHPFSMDFQLPSWLGIFAANVSSVIAFVSQPQAQGYDSGRATKVLTTISGDVIETLPHAVRIMCVNSQCRQWFLWCLVEHIAFDVSITGSGSRLHARHPRSAVPVN